MSGAISLTGNERVLIVRLGAMGDILHALPAVESLKRAFPSLAIDWIAKPRWIPLLQGNPSLCQVIPFDRQQGSVWAVARRLREAAYDLAIDLQGLLQSALVAKFSGAKRTVGYAKASCREPLASMLYQHRVEPAHAHIAQKHLDVVRALGVDQSELTCTLPAGEAEGDLPRGPFVLASPFAGWRGKQWPLEHYAELASRLSTRAGVPLVLNVAEADRSRVAGLGSVHPHVSSLAGLIHATRRASAVVGVDSGPLHLAAAVEQRGVAIFGPTDPTRNGPVAGNFAVLRDPSAHTTYKRDDTESEAMRKISPGAVFEALQPMLLHREHQQPAKESHS